MRKQSEAEADAKLEGDPELVRRVIEYDTYFGQLIDRIPPEQYGFDAETRDLLRQHKHQLVDSKLSPVNRTLTELRKKFHGTRGKQKIARIDPDQLRTVSQIQKWLARCAGESNSNEANASKQGREMSGEGKTRGGPNAQPTPGSNYPAFSREQLRQKLMDKLDALKKKRKADAVDYQERIRLKRRLSKLKLKERRTAEKSTHQQCPGPPAKKSKLEAIDDQPTPILNSEGKIVYSKFDLATKKQEDKGKQLAGKDYKKLLNVVVKRNEKLADLKGRSPETAAKFESKLHWQAALQRAGGRKVKDDPELLKKNLKRTENRKARSRKKWEARQRTVAEQKATKQQKRRTNLDKRIDAKRQKSMQMAKKKGRFVPGF